MKPIVDNEATTTLVLQQMRDSIRAEVVARRLAWQALSLEERQAYREQAYALLASNPEGECA